MLGLDNRVMDRFMNVLHCNIPNKSIGVGGILTILNVEHIQAVFAPREMLRDSKHETHI